MGELSFKVVRLKQAGTRGPGTSRDILVARDTFDVSVPLEDRLR